MKLTVTARGRVEPLERCSSLYRLITRRGSGVIGAHSGGAVPKWAVRQPDEKWRLRSEGLVTSKHVPDRLGELAGEVDLRDLRAALAAQPASGALVALAVERVRGGGDRGLHEPPAQILRAVLGQWAALVHLPGLLDARAQAGVAGELDRRGEAADVPELARHRVAGDPSEPGGGQEGRDVAVIGARATQLLRDLSDARLEVVDQHQAGVDVRAPRLGDVELLEQSAPRDAEQVGHVALVAEGDQRRMHPVLQRGAVL